MSFAVSLLIATASASRTNDFVPSLMDCKTAQRGSPVRLSVKKSHMGYLFHEVWVLLAHVL